MFHESQREERFPQMAANPEDIWGPFSSMMGLIISVVGVVLTAVVAAAAALTRSQAYAREQVVILRQEFDEKMKLTIDPKTCQLHGERLARLEERQQTQIQATTDLRDEVRAVNDKTVLIIEILSSRTD